MNREILFRGKWVDNGEWVEGDLIHGVNHKRGKIFILPIEGGVSSLSSGIDPIDGWEVIPETVGQFTGLTDKNGSKIFEGDIVKWDDRSNGKYWRIAEVKINPSLVFDCSEIKEFAGVKNSSDHVFRYGNFIYRDTHNHLEIISNIHDKPINP